MELNKLLDKKLTTEQKVKFERYNGKFKVLNNLIILPIATAILGIYFESIIVVSVSIVCIIIFLLMISLSTKKRDSVYEDIIIPYVLKEKFMNIEKVVKDENVEEEFNKSGLGKQYSRFKSSNYLRLHENRYSIEFSKIVTSILKDDDENLVGRELDENFSGLFAYVKLPNPFEIEFEVKENKKTISQVNSIDKADVYQVKMNNLDFDMQYDVIANDPSLVRKVLSLGVMARILEINKKFGRVIEFSVKNNVLYILIKYEEFLKFKSIGKEKYVDEKMAMENMDTVELLDYFVRYFVNLTEI